MIWDLNLLMVMFYQEVKIVLPSLHISNDVYLRHPRFGVNWYPCLIPLIKPRLILDWHLGWLSIIMWSTFQLTIDQDSTQFCRHAIKCPSTNRPSIKLSAESQRNQDIINFHISISTEMWIEHQMRVLIGTRLHKSSINTQWGKGPAIN